MIKPRTTNAILSLALNDKLTPLPINRGQFVGKMQEGRQSIKTLCLKIAEQYTPPDVTITYSTWLSTDITPDGAITVPRPYTRKALYLYLVGVRLAANASTDHHTHMALRFLSAHESAQQIMRDNGLSAPRQSVQWLKGHVRDLLENYPLRPTPGGRKIRRFAGCYQRAKP